MNKFNLKIAELTIGITCRYNYLLKIAKDYIVLNDLDTDFNIDINSIDVSKIYELSNNKNKEYIESISIYNEIANNLPKYSGFMIHGASILYRNKGFLFIAPAGTGKTTHINMWKENLKGLKVVNGDKPIVRIINSKPVIYGNPWNGKENYGENLKNILNSIIILKRGKTNKISKVNGKNHIKEIINQIYIPNDSIVNSLNLLDKIFKEVEFYEMFCTNDIEAFKVAYKELIGEDYESK